MYFKRTLSESLEKATKTFPVVFITGPRQVGKTTILEHCSQDDRTYVSLDDPQIRFFAKNDPALFFQRYKTPILIDEIQYAPELFSYIKMIVDKEKKSGLFWLTGSQQFHLMKNISESLAGRVAILDLQGLSQSEKYNKPLHPPFLPANNLEKVAEMDLKSVYEVILKGSYPALYAQKDIDRVLFYSSYLRTYLERDVRDLLKISDEQKFITFLKVAAARTGQLLNYADIARDVDVSQNTVKSWISILQTSGLIYLLHPYYTNITSRVIKTPKLYFLDTGLCCYLAGWNNSETLETSAMSGAIFETYVVSEIIKSYWHNGKQIQIYFYRDKEKKEIDVLIEENGILYPIEIKKSANPTIKDIKNFSILNSISKTRGLGAVICFSNNYLPLTSDVIVIPVSYL